MNIKHEERDDEEQTNEKEDVDLTEVLNSVDEHVSENCHKSGYQRGIFSICPMEKETNSSSSPLTFLGDEFSFELLLVSNILFFKF